MSNALNYDHKGFTITESALHDKAGKIKSTSKIKIIEPVAGSKLKSFSFPVLDLEKRYEARKSAEKWIDNYLKSKVMAENTEKKIDWEIEQRFEKIDYHTQEVSLTGTDETGGQYVAYAVECCGEIEDINDIEKVEKPC